MGAPLRLAAIACARTALHRAGQRRTALRERPRAVATLGADE